jgi:hypothetical protein
MRRIVAEAVTLPGKPRLHATEFSRIRLRADKFVEFANSCPLAPSFPALPTGSAASG